MVVVVVVLMLTMITASWHASRSNTMVPFTTNWLLCDS